MTEDWSVVPPWWQPNLHEPAVLAIIRDLCRPGTTAFDVGANIAALTLPMARAVGPRGVVCAFEASPRVLPLAHRNIVSSGCGNVHLQFAAVSRVSGPPVPYYFGSHAGADSLYPRHAGQSPAAMVPTVALDDVVRETGYHPDFVKLDIEGAEFDAVMGMADTIRADHPHLVIEESPGDPRSQACFDWLAGVGYCAYDLNTYAHVRSIRDDPGDAPLRNTLHVHQDRLSSTPFAEPVARALVLTLGPDAFAETADPHGWRSEMVPLAAGRYLVDVDFTSESADIQLSCGVRRADQIILRYEGYGAWLAASYHNWVLDLPFASEVGLFLECRRGPDPSLTVGGATVVHLPGFDRLSVGRLW
jgi:FkbM family methyltransferase